MTGSLKAAMAMLLKLKRATFKPLAWWELRQSCGDFSWEATASLCE